MGRGGIYRGYIGPFRRVGYIGVLGGYMVPLKGLYWDNGKEMETTI